MFQQRIVVAKENCGNIDQVTLHSFLIDAGWAAVLAGLVSTLAQHARVSRLGVEGVSLATWELFGFMSLFWTAYGAASAHSWEIIWGSAILLPFQASIVKRLRPWRNWRETARTLGFFLACCAVPMMVWGWAGGVYGIGLAAITTRIPQIVELIRQEDASGVSVGSWAFGSLSTVLWVPYYIGVKLWAALISTSFAGVASLTIVLLVCWRHNQGRRELIITEVFAD